MLKVREFYIRFFTSRKIFGVFVDHFEFYIPFINVFFYTVLFIPLFHAFLPIVKVRLFFTANLVFSTWQAKTKCNYQAVPVKILSVGVFMSAQCSTSPFWILCQYLIQFFCGVLL